MEPASVASRAWWWQVVLAVARHPSLWLTALGQAWRLAPAGWWHRPPFLPLPDPAYLRFRMETQYGAEGTPQAGDVVTYLHWCRGVRALS